MPYKRKILALWIFQCLYSAAIAQSGGVIKGRIVDSAGTSLDLVTVTLLDSKDSLKLMEQISNKEGIFLFEDIKPGDYLIKARLIGYQNIIYGPCSVKAGLPVFLTKDIVLLNAPKVLKEVEIKANENFIEAGSGRFVLNVDKSLISSGRSAFDVLRKAPGIVTDANGGIAMRGRQGVTILIDGKPVNLSSADAAELLKNLSSDLIDQIDLISNPSSNYDAGGNAGVINIKLKKNLNNGTNGSLTLGSGYGENYKLNTALSFNDRQKFFNIYGSWALNNNKRADRYQVLRSVEFEGLNTGFDIENYDLKSFLNHSYKTGLDYFISKNHTLGFMYTGMHNHMFSDENNHTFISSKGATDSTILTLSDESRTVSNNAFNLNYKGDFKSFGSIGVDLDYLNYRRRSKENISYFFYNPLSDFYKDPAALTNQTPSHITIKSLKVDYSSPLTANSLLQAGIKNSIVSGTNRREISGIDDDSGLSDSFMNDDFRFGEKIQAAYINYSREFKENKLELGLRGEYTRSEGRSVLEGNVNRDYFNLFPYFNFSFRMNKDNKASLLYNRRINRPAYDDLNPFRYFLDQYTYREGNPYLKPEYSNSVELSDVYKKNLTGTLSYNYVKDYYLTFSEQNDSTKVSRSIKKNLRWYKSLGLEINYSLNISSWFNSNLNIQGYYRKFNFDQEPNILRNSTFFSFSTTNGCKLSKGINAELTFNYESPTVSGMYNFKSVCVLDAGVGKSVLNKRGSLRLSVSDILNSDRNRYHSNLSDLNFRGEQKSETRIVGINFSYKFGRNTVVAARNRKTGNEQESKRVSN